MNLKTIANAVTSKAARQVLTMRKHSPVLLFAGGVVGVVGTVVLASRATLKLDEVLSEAHETLEKVNTTEHARYSEEDRNRDRVLVYVKTGGKILRMYAPAAALGFISIAMLTGSHVILTRRNTAMMAAYAVLDRGFKQYRARVVKQFGPEADAELRYELEDRKILEETSEGPQVRTIRQPAMGAASVYARFFDESNRNWNKTHHYNQFFIQCQQNYANDLLRSRGHVFLNEVYEMLGMPHSREGAVVGWIWDGCETEGDGYIDFGVFEGDRHSGMRFVAGEERSILLDFNVDGIIYDKI